MRHSRIIPPIVLVQRDQIEDVLRHQVWADAQLARHQQEVKRCIELTELGCMTPAGARERLTKLARAMHEAIREFAKVAQAALKPVQKSQTIPHPTAVPVPHGHPGEPGASWRQWQWQATNPALGCLAFEAADWNEQHAVANLWIQRAVHRALAVRATGEYLAVRVDGLDRARKMADEVSRQLRHASREFWEKFILAESIGIRRPQRAKLAA
jgi:hypothetical protein